MLPVIHLGIIRRSYWLSMLLGSLMCGHARAEDLLPDELLGRWQMSINAGGEIYKGKFDFSLRDSQLTGTYESEEGRRTQLTGLQLKGRTLRGEATTQRFSVPVTAVFIADVADGQMRGEVDFTTGSDSDSYTFSAKLVRANARNASEASLGSGEDSSRVEINRALEASVAKPRCTGRVSFRQGNNDYHGVLDLEVWQIAPSLPLAKQGTMTVDSNNGGGESQVLMCFDDILGHEEFRIPHHARIISATLRVVAFDPGTTVYVHRLLVPWSAAATWDSLAAGIVVDDVEASTVRDGFTFGQINMDRQSVEFDVTQTVQHWSDGEPNYGWVFVNTGSNGWDFYSSDWHEEDMRPQLIIEYELRTQSEAAAAK